MIAVVVNIGSSFRCEIVAERVRVSFVNSRAIRVSSEMSRFPSLPLLVLFLVVAVLMRSGTASTSLLSSFAGASDLFRFVERDEMRS